MRKFAIFAKTSFDMDGGRFVGGRSKCFLFVAFSCVYFALSSCKQVGAARNTTLIEYKDTLCSGDMDSVVADLNINMFKRCQYFDEFDMRAKGRPVSNPFVYVYYDTDKVYVAVSSDTEEVKEYRRVGNRWYSYEEYELWKKDVPMAKSGNENPARAYYRIVGNDSILELRYCYWGDVTLKDFYIKTSDKCIWVTAWPERAGVTEGKYRDACFDDLLKLVGLFNSGEDTLQEYIRRVYGFRPGVHVYCYSLIDTGAYYIYECKELKEKLFFAKKQLGALWNTAGIGTV